MKVLRSGLPKAPKGRKKNQKNWKKNQKKFFTRKVNGEDQVVPVEVYIARVGAAKVEVPVRIESTSPFGPLVLNLQAVRDPS